MYNKLITNSFLKQITTQNISEDILINCLEDCYKNTAFSTFTYIFHNMNSEQSIKKTNSGNCISLSMYLRNYLKVKYNIHSYLIPATIPNKYKHQGYLDISHVALAVPKNSSIIYILDPAFYFLNPIKVDINSMKCSTVFSKNIYEYEYSNNLKNYSSIDTIESCPGQLIDDKKFNKFQSIQKNTYYAKSYYKNDVTDFWFYFLTEVINPDTAITSFFIAIKKNPFIVTSVLDTNSICKLNLFITITPDNLQITDQFRKKNIYDLNNLDINKIKSLKLKPFLINNILDYVDKFRLQKL